MTFDHAQFLEETLGSPSATAKLLSAYGCKASAAAIQKWFQRERMPAEWLAIVLALLEIDRGQAVSLTRYVR